MFDNQEAKKAGRQKSVAEYLDIIVRRRWWIISLTAIGWFAAGVAAMVLPARFVSESVVLVQQQQVPTQFVQPNVLTDVRERLQSMTEQVMSRARLQKIIDDFNLYPRLRQKVSPDEVVQAMRKDIAIEIVDAGTARRDDVTAFKIRFGASNARLAQQVNSQLTSLFIEENLRTREQQSESTTSFLSNQLNEARTSLETQEAKLRAFKTQYLAELPAQMQSNLQILSGMQSRLSEASNALSRAEQQALYLETVRSQYDALKQSAGATEIGVSTPDSPPDTLDKQIDQLKAQLADLQSRYTDKHPDVIRMKQQIAELEKEKKDEAASAKPKKNLLNPAEVAANSPLIQVEGQIKANKAEIEARKRDVAKLQGDINQLEGLMHLSPLREQQLDELNRDYEQSKANYESLLAKKNQSELASNLEKRQQGEQFQIVDPPSFPTTRAFPNRLFFLLGGAAGGLLIGFVLAFVLEMSRNTLRNEDDFRDLIEVSLLGSIPPIQTKAGESRRRKFLVLESVAASVITIVMCTITSIAAMKG